MKRVIMMMVAMLFVTFTFSQTKTEIKPTELSKNISGYITKNFAGYSIDRAFRIDNKGVMSTQVMISKGSEKLALTFDKEFKLTKKAVINPDPKMPGAKEDKKPLPPVKEKK